MTAQLSCTEASLARLLGISGAQSDFILASGDGSTTVRVQLAVSSVPGAEVSLGNGVTLDWSSAAIARGRSRASLTRTELRLLVALMEHAPAPAPREHLRRSLWPSESVRTRQPDSALAVWICALRRRFSTIGLPQAIRTVRSTGYCLSLVDAS